MKFDVSKVYTKENAEELRPGDKVLVADNLKWLEEKVTYNNLPDIEPDVIKAILGKEAVRRFVIIDPEYNSKWEYAYLIERVDQND